VNRNFDESRRVVRNRIRQPFGEALGQFVGRPLDGARNCQGVGARLQEDANQGGALAVVASDEVVVLAAELDTGHVSQPYRSRLAVGADDDVLELLRVGETALSCDGVDEVLVAAVRSLTDLACCELRVLLVERANHVRGGQLQLRQPVGSHPDPHRVILRAEDLHIGRAR
jgi:hypothetical protein